ncbi:YcgN family cysteine cluster protein [Candidatus Endoriftia persephone]|uniref:UPF0260 protein L0Y14_12750 n=1 Tax=Candidatus Endoriftia persephonae TaxID=393765 RepID=A0A9J7A2A8_9GAMM|nr:YcgN family cysteine cluster protein [endosymbiont of Riftia pachyptila]USF89254.1 YcgN family cysteine cluster protein [Candidatus Endoriftia persephone]
MVTIPFWRSKPLEQLSASEWELLCDGCAKCCLQKLEDAETREIYFTNVVCDLLDLDSCRCSRYQERSTLVPSCITLTPKDLDDPYWLPSTCAYRLLAEGAELPSWHPLRSHDPHSVAAAGHTICGRVVPEAEADDLEYHLIDWVQA